MNLRSLLTASFPFDTSDVHEIYNLQGSAPALFLALRPHPFIAAEKDESKAAALAKDINFFRLLIGGKNVCFIPDPNGPEAAGKRIKTLLSLDDSDSLAVSGRCLSSAHWDKASLTDVSLLLKKGGAISRDSLEDRLIQAGYRQVQMVSEKGEYSRRSWLIDIFPSTSEDPLRIEFFGDEIESMRTFDIETQKSREDKEDFTVLPVSEPEGGPSLSSSLGSRVLYDLDVKETDEQLHGQAIHLSRFSFESADESETDLLGMDGGSLPMHGIGIFPQERRGIGDLAEAISSILPLSRVIVVASSKGQAERLRDILRDSDIVAPIIEPAELGDDIGNIALTVADLSSGMRMRGLLILTEKELFGRKAAFRSLKKTRVADLISSLDEIVEGDYVVHREHGIGRFAGTVHKTAVDSEVELMVLEYENGRLYIPISNIQVISRYRGQEGVVPKTDRLGGKTWQKKKERARKKVHELAQRLLSLYAGRKTVRGYTFSGDTEMHREFDSFFAYEETPDQLKAIADIKGDMESDKPMDRLLCGDVGYGKTEVAMRAAFKAIYDGRQVAVLVPTTILAEQHYRTFSERFSGFPVTVDFISRFKSAKDLKAAKKRIATGETDIVIGTHGLLSVKTSFARLGLLIVDEEHRFGVAQKERIKEMAKDVDVLNLTATPIPRTLQMSLSGIRDISVIETAPEERLSVRSIVTTFGAKTVMDAISAELARGGQVFFVHNRIFDIHKLASKISELAGSARIAIAHGQMPERELEQVMHRFFQGEIDVLVSTSIIGSGLDVPSANTIIINMADKMGLADLYQLRGRVGRSNLKGYALFLAPPESLLSEEAKKRLQAIQDMSYLGAGFRLALKDLEIRGAGDLFGPDQSGHMQEIGFDLYMEMLEQAVDDVKGVERPEEIDPVIELRVSAFIPAEYIADTSMRLGFYRKIASLRSNEDAEQLQKELKDRFGPAPLELNNLIDIMQLKIGARRLKIIKIRETKEKIEVSFSPDTAVQPAHLFTLGKEMKGRIKFLPDGFELNVSGSGPEEAFREVRSISQELLKMVGLST